MPTTLPPLPIPCDYEELEDGYAENYGGGFEGQVSYKVAWADRLTFVRSMLGGPEGSDSTRLPQSFQGRGGTGATGVKITPMGRQITGDNGNLAWPHAVVSVTFGSLPVEAIGGDPSNPDDQTYIEERIAPFAEFLNAPADNLFWANADRVDPDVEVPARLDVGFDWVVTLRRQASIPYEVLTLLGKTNAQAVSSPTFEWSYEPETLLYREPDLSRTFTLNEDGSLSTAGWDVTLKMSYRPSGWNKFFRKGKAEPEEMYTTKVGSERFKPYATADFIPLFGQPPAPDPPPLMPDLKRYTESDERLDLADTNRRAELIERANVDLATGGGLVTSSGTFRRPPKPITPEVRHLIISSAEKDGDNYRWKYKGRIAKWNPDSEVFEVADTQSPEETLRNLYELGNGSSLTAGSMSRRGFLAGADVDDLLPAPSDEAYQCRREPDPDDMRVWWFEWDNEVVYATETCPET